MIFAIVLGLVVGILLVGGIWTANQALQNRPAPLISAEASATPTTTEQPTGTLPLSVVSPVDLSLLSSTSAVVEGKTLPNTHLVIQTEINTYYLRSDAQGTFSQSVNLTTGSNDIVVTALNEAGESAQKTVTVVYSTAKI